MISYRNDTLDIPITVKELIRILEKEDPDTYVLVNGYEDNYDTLRIIKKIHVLLNANTSEEYSYQGRHQEIFDDIDLTHSEEVLILSR